MTFKPGGFALPVADIPLAVFNIVRTHRGKAHTVGFTAAGIGAVNGDYIIFFYFHSFISRRTECTSAPFPKNIFAVLSKFSGDFVT